MSVDDPNQPRPDAPRDVSVEARSSFSPYEIAEQERTALTRIIRLAFLVLFVTITIMATLDTESLGQRLLGPGGVALKIGWHLVVIAAIAIATTIITIDVLTTRKRISTLIAMFVGLVIALLGTYAMGRIIDLLVEIYDIRSPSLIGTVKILIGIALSYLSIVTVLQTKDDFRLIVPYVEFSKQLRGSRPAVIDSSALIDARIADLAATGIMPYPLLIPRFVVAELQALADSQDPLKRARGRRGLDVIAKLQRTPGLDVSIDETPVPGQAVDYMLLELADVHDGIVVTTDSGLVRVAGIEGVRTLNVHDLAAAVRPTLVAGDRVQLTIARPGEQPAQGVGYMPDGTMVVVEDGRGFVGQSADVTIVSTLQTSAGRLIFARIGEASPADAPQETMAETSSMAGLPSAPASIPAASLPAAQPPVAPAPQPSASPGPRSPYPPKPPNKRFNSFRNPRR